MYEHPVPDTADTDSRDLSSDRLSEFTSKLLSEQETTGHRDLQSYQLPFKRATVWYISDFFGESDSLLGKSLGKTSLNDNFSLLGKSLGKTSLKDYLYECLMSTIKLEKKPNEGRKTALHGSAKCYKYASNEGIPLPWTPELLFIKEKITAELGFDHDVCLLNYYENGRERFAFHSDREEIGNDVPIVSISFGVPRKFYFKSKSLRDDADNSSTTVGEDIEKHCVV
jgi:hypothetical protein